MARFRVSRRAVQDLDAIWYFIAKDSESAAGQQMDRLHSVFRALAAQPRMGRARPEIGPQMRSFVSAEQVVFYATRTAAHGVQTSTRASCYSEVTNLLKWHALYRLSSGQPKT
jgi:toxin ParE1/3/4